MTNSWYERKLRQPQPERHEATPPTHFAPLPLQQGPVYTDPVRPDAQNYQAPQRFDMDEYWKTLDPNTEAGRDARRQALLNNPKPGPGNQAAGTCPNCHGTNFFPRPQGGIQRPDVYPAPQCYDCGYPLVQSGSIGGQGKAAWQ